MRREARISQAPVTRVAFALVTTGTAVAPTENGVTATQISRSVLSALEALASSGPAQTEEQKPEPRPAGRQDRGSRTRRSIA